MGLEIGHVLPGHDLQLLGPAGCGNSPGNSEEDVVPGLGSRVEEARRLAQDRGLVAGRGAPEVEDGLIDDGLAAPIITVVRRKGMDRPEPPRMPPPPGVAPGEICSLDFIVVDGLGHLRLHGGEEPGGRPHHFFAGDERLQAADLQGGIGLPGQTQGLLQVQGGRRGRGWNDGQGPTQEAKQ